MQHLDILYSLTLSNTWSQYYILQYLNQYLELVFYTPVLMPVLELVFYSPVLSIVPGASILNSNNRSSTWSQYSILQYLNQYLELVLYSSVIKLVPRASILYNSTLSSTQSQYSIHHYPCQSWSQYSTLQYSVQYLELVFYTLVLEAVPKASILYTSRRWLKYKKRIKDKSTINEYTINIFILYLAGSINQR